MLTLAGSLEPRLLVGQGLRRRLHRLCFQLLDHRFPGTPTLIRTDRARAPVSRTRHRGCGAVEQAAQDKVGRYEVPRGDLATLKKIANPLKLGVMHEQAFVLLHDWPRADRPEGRPATPRSRSPSSAAGSRRSSPACPPVQNLVVVCYAIQADKEWLRGGQPMPAPGAGRVTDDMVLRGQELPTEAEFDEASRRAEGIFGVPREPVRSARAVQAIARCSAQGRSDCAPRPNRCQDELEQHAQTLGLDDDSPRMATSRGSSPPCSPSSRRPTDRDADTPGAGRRRAADGRTRSTAAHLAARGSWSTGLRER